MYSKNQAGRFMEQWGKNILHKHRKQFSSHYCSYISSYNSYIIFNMKRNSTVYIGTEVISFLILIYFPFKEVNWLLKPLLTIVN